MLTLRNHSTSNVISQFLTNSKFSELLSEARRLRLTQSSFVCFRKSTLFCSQPMAASADEITFRNFCIETLFVRNEFRNCAQFYFTGAMIEIHTNRIERFIAINTRIRFELVQYFLICKFHFTARQR